MKNWILKKRWRIISTGILIAAMPVAAFALFVNFKISTALEDRIIKETAWFSNIGARTIEERLNGNINMGKLFVTRPLLLQALEKRDYKELERHLGIFINNEDSIERTFITTPKGMQIANYPYTPDTIGIDFSNRDWFEGVSKKWTPYISDFYVRMAKPQRYLFAIAIPIRRSNDVIGIFVMQPRESYIKDILRGIKAGEGHIYAVDKKGSLIYHPDLTIDRQIDFSGVTVVQKVMKGLEGTERTDDPLTGEAVISSYYPINGLGWGVIMDKPVEIVLAPVREINLWLFSVAVIMFSAGAFFAYQWAEMLVSAQKLTGELQQMNEELQAANEELKTMNEEIRDQQKALEEANSRLADVSKAKSNFLANMSHELRTPLNSILGFSEILEDRLYGPINEKQLEYVRYIITSGRHLLNLINDILDLSKVESGKMELEACNIDLKDILDSSFNIVNEKAMKHNISLGLEMEPDACIRIEADARKLKQVMFNPLSNAVKFTPDGGSVSVSARRYVGADPCGCPDEGLFLQQDFIEISVADTGIGIKQEDIPRLFQEFTQLESAYTKNYEGTGLGLVLTKKLIELHNGRILVESEFGKGSRFSFVIPVKQTAKTGPAPEEAKIIRPAGE